MKFNTCLSEISEIVMGQSPKGDEVNNCGKGVPLLNGPTEFTDRYPEPVQFTESGKKFAEKGDILFCVRGSTTGRMNYADQKYAIGRGIGAIRGGNGFPTPYVRAVIEQNLDRLLQAATGSTFPNVGRDMLNNFEVASVGQEDANRINQFIVSLEGKVYLNSQINQTLEQMAQAIFKSWFVDFEPVKAKIAALEAGGSEGDALLAAMQAISGKAPEDLTRLQAEQPEQYAELCATAELFPSAMQDSELGEIPEGWKCLALDQIAKYQNGLALQKFRPENEGDYLPVVKIAQLKKGYADHEEKASPNIKPDCIIDNGDVVFSWSGSLLVDTWCGGKAALNQHLFKVTSESYPKWLYFHFTRHHLEEFQRIAADKAVTMGHIKREHLKRALCAVPGGQLIERAGSSLNNILEKQIELRLQSLTLSTLRDTLLPNLLSGELLTPETENHTEVCT